MPDYRGELIRRKIQTATKKGKYNRNSLDLFRVLLIQLVKDFFKIRCRLALLPFLISCLIWLDLVASLPLIKERILMIILILHFLSLMFFIVMRLPPRSTLFPYTTLFR